MSNTAMYRGRFVHSHKNKSLRAHPIHDPFDKKLLATHRREVARILSQATHCKEIPMPVHTGTVVTMSTLRTQLLGNHLRQIPVSKLSSHSETIKAFERRLEPRLTPPSGLTEAEYSARKEQLEKHRPTGRVNPIRLFGEFESTHVDFKRN